MRTLALMRAVGAAEQPTLHISYEQLERDPGDTLRRVVAFVAGADVAAGVDVDGVLRRARVPLKNTAPQLGESVTNVVELAELARSAFPFLVPSLTPELVAALDARRVDAKHDVLQRKAERERAYEQRDAELAAKIFDVCSQVDVGRARRPRWHWCACVQRCAPLRLSDVASRSRSCSVLRDFLAAGGGQATSESLTEYFENLSIKNPVSARPVDVRRRQRRHRRQRRQRRNDDAKRQSVCVHFAIGLDTVARFNATTQLWQLKEVLHY